jgi:hypothetical protein
MKVKITRGTVTHNNKEYKTGQIADFPDDDAKRLLDLGVAEKAGGGLPSPFNKGSDGKK